MIHQLTENSKAGKALYLPEGWIDVQRFTNHAFQSYTTENLVHFDGGLVEVRRYDIVQPVEFVWTNSKTYYFINLHLTPVFEAKSALLNLFENDSLAKMGRIKIVPPGQTVYSCSTSGRFRSMRCMLESRLVDGILNHKAEWNEKSLTLAFRQSGGAIESLLLRMYQEIQQNNFAARVMLEVIAKAISVELIRRFELAQETADEPRHVGGLAPWRMRLLRERIYSDRLPPPTLTELAELSCMNVRHLNRAFKEETNQTLGKFIKSAVIERALTLLSDTDKPINEIARILGYATSASFSYAFRKATGLLPSEIKRRLEKRLNH